MTIKYSLSFDDCMQQQLYMADKSPLIKARRRRSHLLIPLAYVGFGIYAMMSGNQGVAAAVMFAVALIWMIFYPKYSQWRYKRYFHKWINERHKDIIGTPIEMKIQDNEIELQTEGVRSAIDWSEIDSLVRFDKQFLFLLTSGSSIIIAQNADYSAEAFIEAIENRGLPILDERNWEWK